MPLTFDQSDKQCLVRLAGEIGIASAAELKKLLLEAVTSKTDVLLDFEQATDLDITALQLLWAAEREAHQKNLDLKISGQLPSELVSLAVEAGLEKFSLLVKSS